ncbi:MAG: hypothetical protein ACYCY7_12410 [Gallionella sp.]
MARQNRTVSDRPPVEHQSHDRAQAGVEPPDAGILHAINWQGCRGPVGARLALEGGQKRRPMFELHPLVITTSAQEDQNV